MSELKAIRVGVDDEDDGKMEELRRVRALIAARELIISSSPACDEVLPKRARRGGVLVSIPQVEGVTYIEQNRMNNCGQTSLRMVGVNEQEIAGIGEENDRQINTLDMFRLVDKGQFELGDAQAAFSTQASQAQVLLCTYPGKENHWVVQAGGYIFDPARGVMPSETYQQTFRPNVLAAFQRNQP